jgi:hypothetical protein
MLSLVSLATLHTLQMLDAFQRSPTYISIILLVSLQGYQYPSRKLAIYFGMIVPLNFRLFPKFLCGCCMDCDRFGWLLLTSLTRFCWYETRLLVRCVSKDMWVHMFPMGSYRVRGLHSLHLWPGSLVTWSPFGMRQVALGQYLTPSSCDMCDMQWRHTFPLNQPWHCWAHNPLHFPTTLTTKP